MTRVEKLRQARRNPSVAWTQFVIGFTKDSERLFCFFEGDDAKYYGVRIDMIIRDSNRVNLPCNGRDGVLYLFDIISKDERYKNAWLAFFIDRDYDDVSTLPNSSKVYITPCYSVENLYVSCTAFKRILTDEFKVSSSDPTASDFSRVIRLYEARLNEFNDATQELNVWIFLNRLAELAGEDTTKLNLNNVNMNHLVEVKLDTIQQKYTLEGLPEIFKGGSAFSTSHIHRQATRFPRNDRADLFRGKYLIAFLRLFLLQLKQDRVSLSPAYFSDRGTVRLSLSLVNIISELCQYADTPDCLRKFLEELLLFKTKNAHC